VASVDAQVAHIWRRLGFGPRPGDVEAGVAVGTQALINDLCNRPATTAAEWAWPAETGEWEDYVHFSHRVYELLATSPNPMQERLYWFLSGVLVVAGTDFVQFGEQKQHVNQLRSWPAKTYKELLLEVLDTAPMQDYLNGIFSEPPHANENLARETLELFSLGVTHPVTGAANYAETDVKEVARALTGYRYDWESRAVWFDPAYWDTGTKTFLGAARGAAKVTHVVDAVAGHDAFRYFVPRQLYRHLVGLDPDSATMQSLASVWGTTGNIKALVQAIAARPEFLSDAAINSRVKSPLELVISLIRVLGLRNIERFSLDWELSTMGQDLFWAPNVSGWPEGAAWLHAGQMITWSRYVSWFCWSDDGDPATPVSDQCPTIRRLLAEGTSATGGDLALTLAGLRAVSATTQQAVRDYAAAGTWDIYRACGTMNLVLVSPEFLVN
jgi:hypothetical protein